MLLFLASVGPISVALNADKIKLYKSGVFDDSSCGTLLNHGVLAVGYASLHSKDYWILKNSWGASWGEDGYMRISRNKKMCGIGSEQSYPLIA